MNVLVTGATGFLGTALLRALILAGISPIAVARSVEHVSPDIEAYSIDVTDRDSLKKLLRPVDAVVHLAGNVSHCIDSACFVDNVSGAYEVACWASTVGARVLYLSTMGVYNQANGSPVSEDAQVQPRNLYSVTKALGESAVAFAVPDSLILRLTYTYGPGDSGSEIARIINSVRREQAVTTKCQKRDLLYITDATSAIVKALQYKGRTRFFNVGTGSLTGLDEVAQIAMDILDTRVPVEAKGSYASVAVDAHQAKEKLGWMPEVTVRTGISSILSAAAEHSTV